MSTTRQKMIGALDRANAIFRKNKLKIIACNGFYMTEDRFGCDLYNRSNRKRIRIWLHLWDNTDAYLLNKLTKIK